MKHNPVALFSTRVAQNIETILSLYDPDVIEVPEKPGLQS